MKRILVIRLSALGDVAMASITVRAFVQQHPEIEIVMLSKAFVQPLFEDIQNVTFHAVDTKKKHKGFLLIHRGGVVFKSRFSHILFDIPGDAIQKVYHGDSHKGSKLYQSAVKIDFLNAPKSGEMETIAFKMAYPPQWIKIIGKTFLAKPSS